MSTSKPELLTENVALREEIDQLRAALVLWRDLYEVVNARSLQPDGTGNETAAQGPSRAMVSNHESSIVEACGPGFQHLALICIEEGLSLAAATRIADCVRIMQFTTLADAARLFNEAVAMTDGLRGGKRPRPIP